MKLHLLLLPLLLLSTAAHATAWKGIFLAGDDSIENFDNGREDLTAMFSRMGELSSIQLSSSDKHIGRNGVLAADATYIPKAFQTLGVQENEGCLIHMTSHGAKGRGFYLSRIRGILNPENMARLVDHACGSKPTIILVSACYSGQFISDALKGDNRVILTAARADRPSFGCSADTRYTYWDECLLQEIPHSQTWVQLNENVKACITGKEQSLGANPSEPQAFFGQNTLNWKMME